jgi:hypothetical protein
LKPIDAIAVLLRVSLSIAGYTTSETNQTPTPATHDAFLENYLAALKDWLYSNSSVIIKA